jgi:protein-S-isoprenylcysteine O-methyltransferase Ste14
MGIRGRTEVSSEQSSPADPKPAPVARRGWLRPPFVFLGSLLVGGALHLAAPLPLLRSGYGAPVGAALMLAAAALFVWSVRTFRRAGTPVPADRPTTTIVRTGPYRFSRNPIYLSFVLLQVGVAVAADSFWLLVTLLPAVAWIALVVIPREERYLEGRFASDYPRYKASVRRWL